MAYDRYPAVDEDYQFAPVIRDALARSLDLRNTVIPMTQVQRNNLSGANLWDGRTVVNTTTDKINRYDLGTTSWKEVSETAEMESFVATSISEAIAEALSDADAARAAAEAWGQDDLFSFSGVTAGDYTRTGRTRLVGDTLYGQCQVSLIQGTFAHCYVSDFAQAPNIGGNGPFKILAGQNRPVGHGVWLSTDQSEACPFEVWVDPATKKLHLFMITTSTVPGIAGVAPQGLGGGNTVWFEFAAEIE